MLCIYVTNKAHANYFKCYLYILVGFLVCDNVLFIAIMSVWGSLFYFLALNLTCSGRSVIVQILNWKPLSVQVASLRKQKTVEAQEEESEEIKHIKKVINLFTCTLYVVLNALSLKQV